MNGRVLCEVARSDAADVEKALDAAHAAKDAWGRTSVAERAVILNRIADRIEQNLQAVAEAETWDNGKPVRETLAADIPLAIDHFRYFAGCIRAQEGGISELDHDTVAYHFHEPLGVVGQIIPWNFPLLMAAWKIAPALAAGNTVVIKPAETTPLSILVLAEIIADAGLPPLMLMAAIVVLYLFLGMFLDPIGIIVLTLPFVIPLIQGMDMNLIWFGVIVVKLLEIGLITPPVGLNVFVIGNVAGRGISVDTIFAGVMRFLAMDLVVLALLVLIPWISLVIPNAM
mgnify:CR=1 FL=1